MPPKNYLFPHAADGQKDAGRMKERRTHERPNLCPFNFALQCVIAIVFVKTKKKWINTRASSPMASHLTKTSAAQLLLQP